MSRAGQRRPYAFIACCVASLTVGCGGEPPKTADVTSPPPPPIPIATFDLKEDEAPRYVVDVPAADFNSVPIRFWVQRAQNGEIGMVRITGHADAEICSQASLGILEALSHASDVAGFLGYGIGELRPAPGAKRYQAVVGALVERMKQLAATAKDYIEIHETSIDAKDPNHAPPKETHAGVLRFRAPESGPAFIPLRSWTTGQAPKPVTFEVTSAQLGVDAGLMGRLASSTAVAPIVDRVNRLRGRIDSIGRVREFIAGGGELADGVWAYNIFTVPGPVSALQLKQSTELLVRYQRFLDASFYLSRGEAWEQQATARKIAEHQATNEACLRDPRSCLIHYRVEVVMPRTQRERDIITELDAGLTALTQRPASDFERDMRALTTQLEDMKRVVAIKQRESSTKQVATARQVAVDGLLRGWPLPVADDAQLEERVWRLQGSVKHAWGGILAAVEKSGVVLRDAEPAGRLARGNVFFRVRDLGGDRFAVTPIYVVMGPYLEVWNANEHTVTIETRDELALTAVLEGIEQ